MRETESSLCVCTCVQVQYTCVWNSTVYGGTLSKSSSQYCLSLVWAKNIILCIIHNVVVNQSLSCSACAWHIHVHVILLLGDTCMRSRKMLHVYMCNCALLISTTYIDQCTLPCTSLTTSQNMHAPLVHSALVVNRPVIYCLLTSLWQSLLHTCTHTCTSSRWTVTKCPHSLQ